MVTQEHAEKINEIAKIIYDDLEGEISDQDFKRQSAQWAQCQRIAEKVLGVI